MPGIPTSNRCEYCKRRKIKCDEGWPTCGACKRTKRSCSGPVKETFKFVHNGNHKEVAQSPQDLNKTSDSDTTATTPGSVDIKHVSAAQDFDVSFFGTTFAYSPATVEKHVSLVEVKHNKAATGTGVFSKMRFDRGSKPRRHKPCTCVTALPYTKVDLLITRLISSIQANAETPHNIFLSIPWLHLTPARIASSSVLYDCVDLLLSTWANSQRCVEPSDVLDRASYGRAISGLRAILADPVVACNMNTLAATSLVHKVVTDFETSINGSQHTAGLYTLMVGCGPPRTNDDLEVHLCFDNVGLLLHHILEGSENFYTTPAWKRAMRSALHSGVIKNGRVRDQYELSLQVAEWPDLATQLQNLRQDPEPQRIADFLAHTKRVVKALSKIDAERIQPLWASGDIAVKLDANMYCGKKYVFADWATSQLYITHAMTSIAITRMLGAAAGLIGGPCLSVEEQTHEWSDRIWKTWGYVDMFPLAAKATFLAPLILSFESASDEERMVLTAIAVDYATPLVQRLKGRKREPEYAALPRPGGAMPSLTDIPLIEGWQTQDILAKGHMLTGRVV